MKSYMLKSDDILVLKFAAHVSSAAKDKARKSFRAQAGISAKIKIVVIDDEVDLTILSVS